VARRSFKWGRKVIQVEQEGHSSGAGKLFKWGRKLIQVGQEGHSSGAGRSFKMVGAEKQ